MARNREDITKGNGAMSRGAEQDTLKKDERADQYAMLRPHNGPHLSDLLQHAWKLTRKAPQRM